jgi:excisionase family DNA binding protein
MIVVPRDWLESELQGLELARGGGEPGDLTVEQAAKQLHRAESTVRDWMESGRFPGAYKRGKAWRVPRAALQEGIPTDDERVRLGAWRAVPRSRE